jgi:RNA polymerase sigma-70 factor (sigma-E family)
VEVKQMSGRDHEFEQFVAARSKALMRLAYLLTADNSAADDLLQTALIRAYVRWSRISSNPEAYIRRVLVTAAIDEARRPFRRRETTTAEMPVTASPADGFATVEERIRLRAALADLPPRQRAAVVLRHWVDLDVARAAEILGCSEGTVRSQTARGLDKLRSALTGTDERERNPR